MQQVHIAQAMVVEVEELDEEQKTALRAVSLRPNDFQIVINMDDAEEEMEMEE